MNQPFRICPRSDSDRAAAYQTLLQDREQALGDELRPILAGATTFCWELGCGHGHFLTAYATAHPNKVCIGIDIASDRIARAKRKRDRARLTNLYFLQAEAHFFLRTLPPPAAFSELFILFPDPWPKLRHQKHRIISSEFLALAAARAAPHAQLCFRTDFAPYFEAAQKTIIAHSNWQLTSEAWPFESSTVFQSRAADYQSLVAHRNKEQGYS